MTIPVSVYIENAAELVADGYDTVRLFSDSDPGGAFATAVDTAPLVATQLLYAFEDSVGATWYRYDVLDTGGAVSLPLSPAFRSGGLTLRSLRINTAIEAGVGFKSRCTGTGETTELVDAALLDSGKDTSFLNGSWIYRPDAAAAGDKVRRVDSFDLTGAHLTPSRAWTNAPANDEEYHVFNLLPPIDVAGAALSYDRVIRSALAKAWFPDQIVIAEGDNQTRRFDITPWWPAISPRMLRRVVLRRFDQNGEPVDADAGLNGSKWDIHMNGQQSAYVELLNAPGEDIQVIAEVNRVDTGLYADTDVTLCPFDLAVFEGVRELFDTMELLQPGKYGHEAAAALRRLEPRRMENKATTVIRGF